MDLPLKKKRRKVIKGVKITNESEKEYLENLSKLYEKIPKKRKNKLIVEHPCVIRSGKRQTAFLNISKIAKQLNRDLSHLAKYICLELGAKASNSKENVLLIGGVFTSLHLESIIFKYVKEYVYCKSCFGYETRITRKETLQFLDCLCGSKGVFLPLGEMFALDTSRRKDRV